MKINKATAAKLRKYGQTKIADHIGRSKQVFKQWLDKRDIPEEYIISISEYTKIEINGKWSDGKRERCRDCGCEKICK